LSVLFTETYLIRFPLHITEKYRKVCATTTITKTIQTNIENEQVKIPQDFSSFLHKKLKRNANGGRPSFISELAKDHNISEEILNILELAWIKNKGITTIANKYHTTKDPIWRLLKDLEPFKNQLVEYLLNFPRRKRFYIRELNKSDYETVQQYILRAHRDGLKRYKRVLRRAEHIWRALNCSDPSNWTTDEVLDYLSTLTDGAASGALDAIRQIAPQIRNRQTGIRVGRFRDKVKRHKKNLFGAEINMIQQALRNEPYLRLVFDLHITLGAREGAIDPTSGMTGLTWDKFHENFTRCDLYESKVRGGITWRDCPTDLFFVDLPDRLRALWIQAGKPTTTKVIPRKYRELLDIYNQIRKILKKTFQGKIDPSLLKEFVTLKPHDADKIHVNMLWEAGVPLEIVAGEYLGQGEGIGLVGRGWLDLNTIKKYYLSLTTRSKRFQKIRDRITRYSAHFDCNQKKIPILLVH
jgi:hypothetical protein